VERRLALNHPAHVLDDQFCCLCPTRSSSSTVGDDCNELRPAMKHRSAVLPDRALADDHDVVLERNHGAELWTCADRVARPTNRRRLSRRIR
jgi:hypothetical protein